MIVIDASIAVKWTVEEVGRELAVRLLSAPSRMVAPDLLPSEVASALRKKVKSDEISAEQAAESLVFAMEAIDEFMPATEISGLALSISLEIDHSTYDCMYLACALRCGGVLVTADMKFHEKCTSSGYSDLISTADEWWSRPPVIDDEDVTDITRLSEKIHRTFQTLRGYAGEPLGEGGLRVVRSTDFGPAFESPAYLRLRSLLMNMPPDEVATILAVAWLGRGYGATNWAQLRSNATLLVSEGVERHLPYFIGLMQYVADGLRRWNELYGNTPLGDR